jgi:RNA polymerase sigma-70 factor (ECF subfamily)
MRPSGHYWTARFEASLNRFGRSDDYIDRTSTNASPLAGIEDGAVLLRIAQHDGDALAELYRRHCAALFNFHLSLVHDQAAAEDLLQEVFLAVWKGAGKFRGASTVKTWLFNIAYNQSVSWLRKRKSVPIAGIDEIVSEPGVEQTALDNLHRQATNQAILQALASLTPEHRAVIELAFYHNCSYAQIAEILGCPVGTVKSRISYARRQLLALLRIGELTGQGVG